jgi:hypothetical protein
MSAPFLETKKFLVGRIEEQLIPTIAAAKYEIPLGTISAPLSKGTGLEVDITTTLDVITSVIVHAGNAGTGYAVGDYVLVGGASPGYNGLLKIATITPATGAVLTLTIVNGGIDYPAGTTTSAVVTAPMPAFMMSVIGSGSITPQKFVLQDSTYSEQVSLWGIILATGVLSVEIGTRAVPATNTNAYTGPYASILTPGIRQTFTAADFNARLRALTMAPAIAPDGEAEKFATGDHRKDFSIMGVRSGVVGFSDKVAVQKSTGTGAEFDFVAIVPGGPITSFTITPVTGHAGTGYLVGDLLSVTGGGGTGAIIQVAQVVASTGAVVLMSGTIIAGGNGYTTGSAATTALLMQQLPVWAKFCRAQGRTPHWYTTVGIGLRDVAAGDQVTMTLGMCYVQGGGAPAGEMYTFAGASGTGGLEADGLGKPWTLKGSMTGKFCDAIDLTNAQILAMTGMETVLPEKMLSNAIQTVDNATAAVSPLRVSKFGLDFGCKVSPVGNQADDTGYDYFMITDRDPKITFDPLLKPISEEDVITNVKDEHSFDITIQSAMSSPNITVEGPRAQLMMPTFGAKEGQVDTARTYRLLGNDLGAGKAVSALSEECSNEILLWARA